MYNEDGPYECDRWEENIQEQYEEYCASIAEDDYTMSYEAYRNWMIEEMEEHLAGLQEEVCI